MKQLFLHALICSATSLLAATVEENIGPARTQTNQVSPEACCQPARPACYPPMRPIRLYGGGRYQWLSLSADTFPTYQGNLWGGDVGITADPMNWVYANLEFSYDQGNLFSGGLERVWKEGRVEFILGYPLFVWPRTMTFNLFAGIAYRRVNDTKRPDGFIGQITFKQSQYTVPFGVFWNNYYIWNVMDIGVRVTALPNVDTSLNIEGMPGLYYNLANTWGVMAELPLRWTFPTRGTIEADIQLTPCFTYQSFGGSNVLLPTPLPQRNQLYWGTDLEIGVRF